jgi:hypothetical protein
MALKDIAPAEGEPLAPEAKASGDVHSRKLGASLP